MEFDPEEDEPTLEAAWPHLQVTMLLYVSVKFLAKCWNFSVSNSWCFYKKSFCEGALNTSAPITGICTFL